MCLRNPKGERWALEAMLGLFREVKRGVVPLLGSF